MGKNQKTIVDSPRQLIDASETRPCRVDLPNCHNFMREDSKLVEEEKEIF